MKPGPLGELPPRSRSHAEQKKWAEVKEAKNEIQVPVSNEMARSARLMFEFEQKMSKEERMNGGPAITNRER
jgi:hypothetical protein